MPIPDDPDKCVSFLIDEGKSREQAIAICAERQSMSKNKNQKRMRSLSFIEMDGKLYEEIKEKTPEEVLLAHEDGSKDRRMRIQEHDESFTFVIYDEAGMSFSESKIGEGVTVLYQNESRYVSAFHFAKPDFSFAEVRQYLIDEWFDPSDSQEESFEMRSGGKKMVFLENVAAIDPKIHSAVPFEDLSGEEWLRAECIAIAQGTWKEFTFTNEMLHQHVEKFKKVNVCEHHSFFEPGDVKGRTLSAEAVEEGIKVSFFVFDDDSKRKINEGFFHSVSSNFLLTVDEDNNVVDIGKVIELTLTDNPACIVATILSTEAVNVNDLVVTKALEAAKQTSIITLLQPTIPPPLVGGDGGKMSEKTEKNQKETSASLEVTEDIRAELQANREAMKELNAKLEDERKARLEAEEIAVKMEATETVKHLVEGVKTIPPAIRNQFEEFYLSQSVEQKKVLKAMFEKAPQVLPTDDRGAPLIDDAGQEKGAQFEAQEFGVGKQKLSENGLAHLLQREKARRQEGANLYSKEQFQWHRGLYDRDMEGPVVFDTDGAILEKEQE